MNSNQIPFNYFYQIFKNEYRQIILKKERDKIGKIADYLNEIFDFYGSISLGKNDQLSIYNQILFDICANYISLSNSLIDVYPANTLEFVELILNTIQENPYKESFLLSLQFIYQDYLACLGKGSPILMSSEDSNSLASFQITLNSSNQIVDFDAVNMDLIDQDKVMTKIIAMESNQQLGPIPQVRYRLRKDV